MASHVLRLQREKQPKQLRTGCQKTAEERGGGEEDMAKHLQRRPRKDGCQLA